jgi:hypothetical protein
MSKANPTTPIKKAETKLPHKTMVRHVSGILERIIKE